MSGSGHIDILMHPLLFEVTCICIHDSHKPTHCPSEFLSSCWEAVMSVFVLVSRVSVHTVSRVSSPTAGPGHLEKHREGAEGVPAQVLRGTFVFKSKPRHPMPSQSVRPPHAEVLVSTPCRYGGINWHRQVHASSWSCIWLTGPLGSLAWERSGAWAWVHRARARTREALPV